MRTRAERMSLPLAPQMLAQRPLAAPIDREIPIVELRTPVLRPWLFRKQLGRFDRTAQPGDYVALQHDGVTLGYGVFNPRAEMAVRLVSRGDEFPDEAWWRKRLELAVKYRREVLSLDEQATAYRVIFAEGDGLPGLVVDRYNDVLVVEAFSLAMYQRAEAVLDVLTELCRTKHGLLLAGPMSVEHEGFEAEPIGSEDLPTQTVITEHGTKFQVDFAGGQKTGFYCDQRENRQHLAQFCAGAELLDLCCYTGGFSLQAQRLGQARRTIGVDLDPTAIATAKANAQLNQLTADFVQGDAFHYVREARAQDQQFDVVVLDPPKLIRSRDELHDGKNKYFDLNRLAAGLVKPGGWMLTCSCSGLMERGDFTRLVGAAVSSERRVQIVDVGGAASDHPVAADCLETEYLKALWLRFPE